MVCLLLPRFSQTGPSKPSIPRNEKRQLLSIGDVSLAVALKNACKLRTELSESCGRTSACAVACGKHWIVQYSLRKRSTKAKTLDHSESLTVQCEWDCRCAENSDLCKALGVVAIVAAAPGCTMLRYGQKRLKSEGHVRGRRSQAMFMVFLFCLGGGGLS